MMGRSLRLDKFNNYKKKCPTRGRKSNLKKSDCHIHATLHERLEAIHILRYEHAIVTLCRVLKVNRSTYYKHFSENVAPRTLENQQIRKNILEIYTTSQKRVKPKINIGITPFLLGLANRHKLSTCLLYHIQYVELYQRSYAINSSYTFLNYCKHSIKDFLYFFNRF